MITVLLGDDLASKDPFVYKIKQQHPSAQSTAFDVDLLDALELDASTLKKSLDTLPVVANKRLIVIDNAHKLKTAVIEVLQQHLSSVTYADIVFIALTFDLPAALKKILSKANLKVFGQEPRKLFDITNALQVGNITKALKELNFFLEEGIYSLNILGVLVWYWGKYGRQYGVKNFLLGWQILQETDTHIKRSRMPPEIALEKAIVTLGQLQQKNP